jgi:hypothetical protein
MPSQYSTEIKAQALALVRQGETAQNAARILRLPERTVQSWAARLRQIAVEQDDRELLDEDYRLALRSSALIHNAYDTIEESGEEHKHLISLNAIRGTAIDKIIKRNQSNTQVNIGQFVITVAPNQLPAINADIVDVTD